MVVIEDFEVYIPSSTAEGQKVQERIINRLEEVHFSPRSVFGIRLALEEALVNAIKHGNRMAEDKRVHVRCRITEDMVRVVIEDEGEGFRVDDVPDPTED